MPSLDDGQQKWSVDVLRFDFDLSSDDKMLI